MKEQLPLLLYAIMVRESLKEPMLKCGAGYPFAFGSACQMEVSAAITAIGPQREVRTLCGKKGVFFRPVALFLDTNAEPCAHLNFTYR